MGNLPPAIEAPSTLGPRSSFVDGNPAPSGSTSSTASLPKRPRLNTTRSYTGPSHQTTLEAPAISPRRIPAYDDMFAERPRHRADLPPLLISVPKFPSDSVLPPFGGQSRPELPPLDRGLLARFDRGPAATVQSGLTSTMSRLLSADMHQQADESMPHHGRPPPSVDAGRASDRNDEITSSNPLPSAQVDLFGSAGLSTDTPLGVQYWGPTSHLALQDNLQQILESAHVPRQPGQPRGVWRWDAESMM